VNDGIENKELKNTKFFGSGLDEREGELEAGDDGVGGVIVEGLFEGGEGGHDPGAEDNELDDRTAGDAAEEEGDEIPGAELDEVSKEGSSEGDGVSIGGHDSEAKESLAKGPLPIGGFEESEVGPEDEHDRSHDDDDHGEGDPIFGKFWRPETGGEFLTEEECGQDSGG